MKSNENIFKPTAIALAMAFFVTMPKAQSIKTGGDIGQVKHGCYAVVPLPFMPTCTDNIQNSGNTPSNPRSQTLEILLPINRNSNLNGQDIWGVNGLSGISSLIIGTNLTGKNDGPAASGTFEVSGGLEMKAPYLYAGFEKNTEGVVTVAGENSTLFVHSAGVIGHHGTGTLKILDGASYVQVNDDRFYAGKSLGGKGIVLVDGVNSAGERSIFNIRNRLYIGSYGDGEFNVTNGAKASSWLVTFVGAGGDADAIDDYNKNAKGVLNVDGIDYATGLRSTMEVGGSGIVVGSSGEGVMNVTNGGLATVWSQIEVGRHNSGQLYVDGYGIDASGNKIYSEIKAGSEIQLGFNEGSKGVIGLTNGAKMSSAALAAIGISGEGLLGVYSGSSFQSKNGIYVGSRSSGNGTVLVDGFGEDGLRSTLLSEDILSVGHSGNGSLSIANGAIANAKGVVYIGNSGEGVLVVDGLDKASGTASTLYGNAIYIGRNAAGKGEAVVRNAARMISENNIYVGNTGSGILNILTGGGVEAGKDFYVGAGPLSDSIVNVVSAPGQSASSIVAEDRVLVGVSGKGELNIIDGSSVAAKNTIFVGAAAKSSGLVNIIGENSVLSSINQAVIGNLGDGVLSVFDKGKLIASKIDIGFMPDSSGVLNVGNGLEAGYIETTEIVGGDGSATLNFNHQSTSKINANLTGSLNLNHINNGETILLGGSSYTGATKISAGTLSAGGVNKFSTSSDFSIEKSGTLNLAGFGQELTNLSNAGAVTISHNAYTQPTTTLKVTGDYVGDAGLLNVSTMLGADGSASDQLLFSGATVSGATAIQVVNAGGLGAQTTDIGIPVVVTEGGTILPLNSFSLFGDHVNAGAYEYRLIQDDQGAALHSTLRRPDPRDIEPPAYRHEVPLLSALPAQLQQADMSMLGDWHKRTGGLSVVAGEGDFSHSRGAWGRLVRTDPRISQPGTVSARTRSGYLAGMQLGADFYSNASTSVGVYVGQLEGDLDVSGFASGVANTRVGHNHLRNRYLGVYGTWKDTSGVYADAVIQAANYRTTLHAASAGSGAGKTQAKGHGWQASFEMGKAVMLNNKWSIEPQAQLIYSSIDLKNTVMGMTTAQHHNDDSWTLRVGARVAGSFNTSAGAFKVYGRANIYKSSNTSDSVTFVTPAATTVIQTQGGYTSSELALGGNWQLTPRTSLYGELGKLWANGGNARVKSGVQASFGVKVLW